MNNIPSYSIRPFLNTKLKAVVSEPDNIEFFPVYFRFIYKGVSYPFKSKVTSYYSDLKFISIEDQEILNSERKLLEKIIDFELEQKGDRFYQKGFTKWYDQYTMNVVEIAERLLIGNLEHMINSKKLKYRNVLKFTYEPGRPGILFDAAGQLMPKLESDIEFIKCKAAILFWQEYQRIFSAKESFQLKYPTVFEYMIDDHKGAMLKILKYRDNEEFELLVEYLDEFNTIIKTAIIER